MEEYKLDDIKENDFNLEEDEFPDPSVETIPPESLNFSVLEESILEAKEHERINEKKKLYDSFNFWSKSIGFIYKYISKQFLQQTDFCNFLIKYASQSEDLILQYKSVEIIQRLITVSPDSIEEFMNYHGMALFVQISNSENKAIRLVGYCILLKCIKANAGFKAFLEEKVIFNLIDAFQIFINLDRSELYRNKYFQNYLEIISSIFHVFLRSINYKDIPPEIPRKILSLLLRSLNANYEGFFGNAIVCATLIVHNMKDEGNKIILELDVLSSVISELNSTVEERLILILQLLSAIFSQRNTEYKIQLFHKVPQRWLINHFTQASLNSTILTYTIKIICNCFLIGMECDWINDIKVISKFNSILEQSFYPEKDAAVKCLMVAAMKSNNILFEKLLESDLLTQSVQFLLSIHEKIEVKEMLKILQRILDRIAREGFRHSNAFDEDTINLLDSLAKDEDDTEIAAIAELLFKNYYPEAFYHDHL